MTVLILLFDGVQSLDVTGPLEVFAGAGYRTRTASPGGAAVRTSSGLTLVPDGDLDAERSPDMVVVPGGDGTRAAPPAIVDWLRRHAPGARRVMAVCSGAFLLAEAGLLAGRRATTHWNVCDALARRYPDVEVDPEPIFVLDGPIATSAGVTAGIDLALALVEADRDRETALLIARHLVMFLRRPANQTQFSAQLSAQVAARPGLREVQRWIADNPSADLSIDELARRANLSPRQFARAFAAEVGQTPGRYVDATRLETARRLLEDGGDGVERVARASGYGTPEAMRRAFARVLGVSPSEYRHRFRPVPQEV
ncbi:GlxA family transcriptional regulator [Actinoplanes sp. NEAU-A12]|uniref:GlxA family transcriptional regulator n=1 Tax=Actinoplanes sandaracinus TaxID=3045177 RepID=A0ABT6WRP2_9ACTN|nr:GlxA family transcriptional regulator [Actinoplanes sandaracinus]MDI6102416.1 GlxA family transcriptional regulator [Actinoplanes sandaracinus]